METKINVVPYKTLRNQTFIKPSCITLENSTFQSIKFRGDQTTFHFFNCYFKKLIINNYEKINFKDVSFDFFGCHIESLEIEKIETDNISIHLASSIFSCRIDNKNLKSLQINNSFFPNSIFLSNIKDIRISYTEENIFPRVWKPLLEELDIKFKLFLKQKQSINIFNSLKTKIYFNENTNEDPGFYERTYEIIREFKVGYRLNSSEKNLLDINVSIKNSLSTPTEETGIFNAKLRSLSLSGVFNGNTSIENTIIDDWYISEFKSGEITNFYNIFPSQGSLDSKLSIHKSNLDNVWFDNVDFNKYSRISFYRSKFSNTMFSSCTFPSDFSSFSKFKAIENIHYPEKITDSYLKDQYEIFLQLKKSFENSGNYFESQKLQSIAHQALHEINNIPLGDKFILWINNKSNIHATSIYRPFWLMIVFSIFFYVLYLLSIDRIFRHTSIDFNLIGYYFSFIDLTHRTDFLVDKENLNGWSLIIDYLNKIVTGFFIYQFIASFRRYGKN